MELPHRNEQLSGFKALGREGCRVLGLEGDFTEEDTVRFTL